MMKTPTSCHFLRLNNEENSDFLLFLAGILRPVACGGLITPLSCVMTSNEQFLSGRFPPHLHVIRVASGNISSR